jgi:hypothetical protein
MYNYKIQFVWNCEIHPGTMLVDPFQGICIEVFKNMNFCTCIFIDSRSLTRDESVKTNINNTMYILYTFVYIIQ